MTKGEEGETVSDEKADTESKAERGEQEELPKDFTVHRYDEQSPEPSPEVEQEEEAEPVEEKMEEKKETPAEQSAPSLDAGAPRFISRLVEDHKYRPDRPVDEIEAERPIRSPEHMKKEIAPRNYKRPIIIVLIAFVTFMVLLILFDLLISSLTVKISTPAEAIEKEVELTVEKDRQNPDFTQNIIGGTQVSQEKSVEKIFKSTGEKEAGDKATGTLTFKNEAGIDDTIAAGVTVTSTSGVEFILDQQVIVPKAQLNSAGDKVLGQATAPVTAKNAGSGGNMTSSTNYIVSGHSKVTASGSTSGGLTKKLKIVSKNDLDHAKDELKNQGEDELLAQISQNQATVVLDGAGLTEVLKFESSKNQGDEAEEFSAKAQVKYTTIGFSQADFRDAITKAVEKDLPADKSLLLASSDTITPQLLEGNINVGKLTVKGQLKSHIGQKPDTSGLSKQLRLKPIKKVKEILSANKDITVESVDLSPSIALPVAPILPSRIKINLEYSSK